MEFSITLTLPLPVTAPPPLAAPSPSPGPTPAGEVGPVIVFPASFWGPTGNSRTSPRNPAWMNGPLTCSQIIVCSAFEASQIRTSGSWLLQGSHRVTGVARATKAAEVGKRVSGAEPGLRARAGGCALSGQLLPPGSCSLVTVTYSRSSLPLFLPMIPFSFHPPQCRVLPRSAF